MEKPEVRPGGHRRHRALRRQPDSGLYAPAAEIAIQHATVILFVCDIKTGLTASDQEVANMLLRSQKPVVLAVNKMDQVGITNQTFMSSITWDWGIPSRSPPSTAMAPGICWMPVWSISP